MKKVQILIITLVSLLTVAGIVFAVLFFTTDTFKSDKEMFYTYISQMNVEEVINVDSQENYQKRLKNESHTNVGTITLKVKQDGTNIIDETFNYDSKVDPVNKLSSSKVTINKNEEDILTVKYLRNEDLYGLKFEEIVNQYVVFENSNLKELATKLGMTDTTNIPDKIDLNEMIKNTNTEDVNLEEFKPILDKYLEVALESIPEEAYSKIEDGYELTIDTKTLQKIYINVLTTLKDDQELFDSINSLISKVDPSQSLEFEEYQETLKQALEEISIEVEENYDILHIKVYEQGKLYIKAGLDEEEGKTYTEFFIEKSEQEMVLKINSVEETGFSNSENNIIITKKINTEENDQFSIKAILKEDETEIGNINLTLSRNGKLDSNNIKNNTFATITIPSENVEMSLEYNNDKTFISNLEIEKIDADNNLVINNLDKDQMQTLITNLGNLITEKTNLNPVEILGAAGVGIISTVPVGTQETLVVGGVLVGTSVTVVLNGKLFETAQQTTQDGLEGMKSQKIQTFNAQFTPYEGVKKGSEIKSLFNTVNASNATDAKHQVEIIGINSAANVDSTANYKVIISYCLSNVPLGATTEPGYIYSINIQHSTDIQDAIETENNLSDGVVEINGVQHSLDEYVTGR